ncbi:type II toxin-antitoxin system RelE/ParE family toxin [Brachymonas sp. G13]
MYTVLETEAFASWVDSIRDMSTRIRLRRRVNRAKNGNLGDVKPVGDGVWEMREFFGPGWRMYYTQRGNVLIIMLGGGDKSSQALDIAAAQAMAREITS